MAFPPSDFAPLLPQNVVYVRLLCNRCGRATAARPTCARIDRNGQQTFQKPIPPRRCPKCNFKTPVFDYQQVAAPQGRIR